MSGAGRCLEVAEVMALVFMAGLVDALSLHRTLHLLVTEHAVRNTVFISVAANGGLFLGSVLLFDYCLAPLLQWLQLQLWGSLDTDSELLTLIVTKSLYLLYLTLWVVPLYLLVYSCSVFWYQEIANIALLKVKGKQPHTTPARAIRNELYRTLVWAIVLVQIWVLYTGAPLLIQLLSLALKKCGHRSLPIEPGEPSAVWATAVLIMLQAVAYVCKALGFCLMCVWYGLYALDYSLTAEGAEPSQKYAFVEKHWVYFMGFGCPCALGSICGGSYFTGYGVYSVVFPFCLLLAAYSGPKREHSHADIPRLPVFRITQQCALYVVKRIDGWARSRRSPR